LGKNESFAEQVIERVLR